MTTILIYNGSNPTNYVCVEIDGNAHDAVQKALQSFTRKLTVGDLAKKLGGRPAREKTATVSVKVSGWTAWVSDKDGTRGYKVKWEPKPKVNEIRDYRTRPAPFLRDGSSRG